MVEIVAGRDELYNVSKTLMDLLPEGGVIILKGDLGSGKTTLVRNFASYLTDDSVTSPTFSLQQIYSDKIYHYDMYQKGFDHFASTGLLEELEKSGWHFVEWGDEKLQSYLQKVSIGYVTVFITPRGDKRVYRIEDAYIKG